MLAERRASYRVQPEPRDAVGVALVEPHARSTSAEVVDISARGAGARMSRDTVPALEPGARVTLAFTARSLAEPLRVSARLAKVEEEEDTRLYGFEFLTGHDVAPALPAEIYRLFNRRGAYRIRDPEQSPVEIRAHDAGHGPSVETVAARVKTLSSSGLGALGALDRPGRLAPSDPVDLRLFLAGRPQPLRLVGWLRNLENYEDTVYYGLEFDARRTPDYLDVAEDIVAFVMEHMNKEHPGPLGLERRR